MVFTDDAVDWWFDIGDGTAVWSGVHVADPQMMRRVRAPRSTAKSRHVPVFAFSTTTGGHVRLESGLEHDLLRELDRRQDVAWLVSQPMRLRLPAKRGSRRLEHTPDLLSLDTNGTVTVWDVRATKRQDDDFKVKADLTRKACRDMDWKYEVFTGLARVRRFNLMWLHGFRREPLDYHGSLASLRGFNAPLTIGAVVDHDREAGVLVAAMWHAIWRDDLHCDLDKHLRRTTRLLLPAT